MPSLWQITAFLLNIKVDALFLGRDILLGESGMIAMMVVMVVMNMMVSLVRSRVAKSTRILCMN